MAKNAKVVLCTRIFMILEFIIVHSQGNHKQK